MPKVVFCEWDTCKFNFSGICMRPDEIKLVDEVMQGRGSMLDCKTFEFKPDESGG